jgi:hypothetical protein
MAAPLMKPQAELLRIRNFLGLILGLNILFWCASSAVYARWSGVPPVPTKRGAIMMTLGDPEFSYRFLAIALQNLGDVGRDITPLKDYNYQRLHQWFFLLHALDPISDHVPMIAAHYFGNTHVPKDAAVVVDYLRVAGTVPLPDKWRWLGHAAYLAQHRMYNLPLALQIAYQLQKLPNSADLPQWARQMPAFVLGKKGEKEAARELMENMLVTEKNLHPQEINNMRIYLTEELGVDPQEVERMIRMRGDSP